MGINQYQFISITLNFEVNAESTWAHYAAPDPEETRVAEGTPRSWTELCIGNSTAELTGDLCREELVGEGTRSQGPEIYGDGVHIAMYPEHMARNSANYICIQYDSV